jgi:hypothetical protein
MSCGGRQKTKTFGLLALLYKQKALALLGAKIQKKSQKCKENVHYFVSLHHESVTKNEMRRKALLFVAIMTSLFAQTGNIGAALQVREF